MPTPRYGTHALKDLLERNETIQAYGEARLLNNIRASISAHNDQINEFLNPLVVFTEERIEPYGDTFTGARVRGHRVDQLGAVDTQRARLATVSESNIGYPLYRWQFAWQFTRDYVETATPADAAARLLAIQQGDLDQIEFDVKNGFFNPVSELTYRDQLIDQLVIPIRRLANADGQPLPNGPNGKVFNPNAHQHYVGRFGGSLTASDITALFDNVIEHGVVGPIRLYINLADEPEVRAMANFYPFEAVEVVTPNPDPGEAVMRNRGPLIETINPPNPENMAIGRWNAKYDVWTKPWVPENYMIVMDLGKRPLRWRSRPGNSDGFGAKGRAALRVVGEHEHFPLRAEWMEREYGIAVGDRVAAAILYTSATSYTMPTLTLPAI